MTRMTGMTRMTRIPARTGFALALMLGQAGGLGCMLVDNPNYSGASETGSGSSDEVSSTGTSSDSATTSTTTTDTSTDSGSDTTDAGWCPPGHAGEVDCPCNDLDLSCDPGLICLAGVCTEPSNCPPEDPGVVVSFDPLANDPSMGTHSGMCDLVTSLGPQDMLIGELSNCFLGNLTKTSFLFGPLTLMPDLPPDLPPDLIGMKGASVDLWVISAEQMFLRVSTNSFDLWLVLGPSLDSGDPNLSDYPFAVLPAGGDCPAIPEPCGASQRQAVQFDASIVFDGNQSARTGVRAWVDAAESVCGVETYRVALLVF